MLLIAFGFASLSAFLSLGFFRKYQARLRLESLSTTRYHRIADYYGRPILLAFEYRSGETDPLAIVEADIDEIYHYGRDYFLKGRSPDGKRCQIYKWSRIANPRVRFDGRNLESLEQLFMAAETGPRAAA
jgi:hypothetical protein